MFVASLVVASPSAAATRYVFAAFKGDSAENEKLSIYTSTDGLNFTLLSNTGYSGPTNVLRDPSLMKHTDGQYYVAYTVYSWDTESTSFAIAKSSDLTHWTFLVSVPAQVTGAKHTWAPEWFRDRDGSTHLIVSVDSPEWDFKPYLYTATNDTLTQWSAPQALGFGPNYIDTFIVTVGSTYHAFAKNETTKYIEHATASNLLGPWTFVGTSDWAGWGSGKEGPALFQLDDGSWRMFMDCYSGCGYLYTSSSDLSKWSATATIPGGLSGTVRHGTVLREETGTGGSSSTGGASNTGGSSAAATSGHTDAGGSSGFGGTSAKASGGASTLGGTTSVAGSSAAGGTNAAGGTRATGGVSGSGGAFSSSAAATGGRSSSSSLTTTQGGTAAATGGLNSIAGGHTGTSAGTASIGGSGGGGATNSGGNNHIDTTSSDSTRPGTNTNSTGGSVVANTGTTSSASDKGCGCSVPGSQAHSRAWLVALAALGSYRICRFRRVRSRK